MLGITDDL